MRNGVGPVAACTVVAVLEVVADGGLNNSGFLTFPLPDADVFVFFAPFFCMKPCLLPPVETRFDEENFLFSDDDKAPPLFSIFYFCRF